MTARQEKTIKRVRLVLMKQRHPLRVIAAKARGKQTREACNKTVKHLQAAIDELNHINGAQLMDLLEEYAEAGIRER